jgi:transcriptional regulator with XRE-family HTH domain
MTVKLSPRLCRAARSLLGWDQSDLAEQSGVPKSTINAFEQRDGSSRLATMNNQALVRAFESAGLAFIEDNGGGAGVRLAKAKGAAK